MYLNESKLLGFISQEPKKSEKSVRFSIYTKKSYKKDGEWKSIAVYSSCVALGYTVEKASKLKKGDYVLVIGEVIDSSWETPDGTKKYATNVQVSAVSVIPLKPKDDAESAPQARTGDDDMSLDDLPF